MDGSGHLEETSEAAPAVAPPTDTSAKWAIVGRARQALLVVVLAFGIYELVSVFGSFEPLGTWLVWRYLGYLALTAIFSLACVSAGHAVVRRVVGTTLPIGEHLTSSFAIGLVAFSVVIFVAGVLGLIGWPLFFVAPLVLFGAGGRDLVRWSLRLRRHLRARKERRPASAFRIAAWVIGGACVAWMYAPVLTPSHVGYDALWYHLPIAEHYIAQGAIRRFPEGWFSGAQPHLASLVYVWGLLLPKSRLFDRVELCAHLELAFFLWKLATVPPLVRALVPRLRAPTSWVWVFLFPVAFTADLTVGGDHASAVFAAPAAVFLIRALPDLDARWCALCSTMLAGVLMTKYSAMPLVLGPVLVIAVRAVWLLIARLRARLPALPVLRGPLVALVVGLVLTSTFWLRNWIFYHDPFYPELAGVFHARPWGVDTAAILKAWLKHDLWAPSHDWAGVKETLAVLYSFSFHVYEWPNGHRDLPIIGSLFTLLVLALPFVRARARVWIVTAMAHVAIFGWYWIHHQERYLTTVYPWMAATAFATAVLVWRSNVLARIGVVVLVGIQALWAVAVPFFPYCQRWVQSFLELTSSTYNKNVEQRFHILSPWSEIGEWLPPKSKVLVHESHVHFGLQSMSVSDWVQWQGGIDYGRQGSPAAIHRLLRGMGVTHVVYPASGQSQAYDSIASDLLFFTFAREATVGAKAFGTLRAGALSRGEPAARGDTVAYLACEAFYAPGVYAVTDLALPVWGAPGADRYPKPGHPLAKHDAAGAEQAVASAEYVVHDPSCGFALPPGVNASFAQVGMRKSSHLYARKHPPPAQ